MDVQTKITRRTLGKRLIGAASAMALAGLSMVAALTPAVGGSGGDGSGGGVPVVGGQAGLHHAFMYDHGYHSSKNEPVQGTGAASIEFFKNKILESTGKTGYNESSLGSHIDSACQGALDRATARSTGGNKPSRVVGLFMAISPKQIDKPVLHGWLSGVGAWDTAMNQYIDQALAEPNKYLFPEYESPARAKLLRTLFHNGYNEGKQAALAGGQNGIRVVCVAFNQDEPPVPETPPDKLKKTITQHVYADSMVNTTNITWDTGQGGVKYVITDKITPNGNNLEVVSAKMFDGETDITNKFTIETTGEGKNLSEVKATWKGGNLPDDHTFRFEIKIKVHKPAGKPVGDVATGKWNDEPEQRTEPRIFQTYDFKPNKSWVRQNAEGVWQAVTDPGWTNETGGDNLYYMNGDSVAAVVNGIVGADLAMVPEQFVLRDDYGAAASILDDTGTLAGAQVYRVKAAQDSVPDINDIVVSGENVTDSFTITSNGTRIVAAANSDLLDTMKHAESPYQYTLLLPFTVSFDSATMLEAHGKVEGDELAVCETVGDAGESTAFLNRGSQTLNNAMQPTNTPKICIWIPPAKKSVVGAEAMNSAADDKDGMILTGNQTVEYRLSTKPESKVDLASEIVEIKFTDTYHELFTPDRDSLYVINPTVGEDGAVINRSNYTVDWRDADHQFIITMNKDWIERNATEGVPAIEVRVSGLVNMDHVDEATLEQWLSKTVDNQFVLHINGGLIQSNRVENPPPDVPTEKDVQATAEKSISVNGKKAMLGDRLYYKISLNSNMGDNAAYKMMRLGIVDDYDEEFLEVKAEDITVQDETGADITDMFNTAVIDGRAYVFAKTVDTQLEGSNDVLKGDPQPDNLKTYAYSRLDPRLIPAIDQGLVNRSLTVVIPATVIKIEDGYVVKNQAMQFVDDIRKLTNIVENPVVPVNPEKDVKVKVGGDSHNGKEIPLRSTFLYELSSSVIPSDRVNPVVDKWLITDQLDTVHDLFTGQWAVYSNIDINVAGLNIKAGDRVAGTNFELVTPQPMFELTSESGLITLSSTAWANENVWSKLDDVDMSWTGYIQVERVAASERVENVFDESFNATDSTSNKVWTRTPAVKPDLRLIKFDEASGAVKGDRNTPGEALRLPANNGRTTIVYRIINTGDTPIGRLRITDVVNVGDASLGDFELPKNWDTLVLQPGEHVDVKGYVEGVRGAHKNTATVTGNPVIPCVNETHADPFATGTDGKSNASGVCFNTDQQLKASDPWHADVAASPGKSMPNTGATVGFVGLAAILFTGAGAALRRGATLGLR